MDSIDMLFKLTSHKIVDVFMALSDAILKPNSTPI